MIFLSKGSVLGGEHGWRLNWHTWQKHFFTIYYFQVFLSPMVWWCNMWKRRFQENIIRICSTECIFPQLYTIMDIFLYLYCLFFASGLMTWTFGFWKCAISCSSPDKTHCFLPASELFLRLLAALWDLQTNCIIFPACFVSRPTYVYICGSAHPLMSFWCYTAAFKG